MARGPTYSCFALLNGDGWSRLTIGHHSRFVEAEKIEGR